MPTSKFDELLTDLGTGKWNFLYFISTSLWFFLIPPQSLSGSYIAPNVGFTCRPPDHLNATVSEDQCTYQVNISSIVEERPCTNFDYDTSVFQSTLTSDFDLVCKRDYLRATYQSIKMFGTFVSPIIGGYLADRFGRRIVATVCLVIFTAMGVGISFLHNLTAILAFRFILGFFNLPTFYVMCMEVTQMKHRAYVGIFTALPWAFGTMAWGGMAYLIRDWRPLQLAVSLPNLVILIGLFFMDESPRWLITNGQHNKAIKVLQKAARWNNAKLPAEDELRTLMKEIEQESKLHEDKDKADSLKAKQNWRRIFKKPDVFSTKKITLITLICSLDYLVVATIFYGLSLNATNFSADPFIYMMLTGLMETPGYSVTAPIIQKFGRKKPTIIGYIVSGCSILALLFVPSDITVLVMILAMIGKMMITGAYQIIYLYINELFPTVVRVKGMGIAIITSRIGSVFAPFITEYIGPLVPWMPSVIFGGSALVAGFATMLLPETLGKPLPDTIQDLEDNKLGNRKVVDDGEEGERETLNKY